MEAGDVYIYMKRNGPEVTLTELVSAFSISDCGLNTHELTFERYVRSIMHRLMWRGLVKVQWSSDEIIYKLIDKHEKQTQQKRKEPAIN